MNTTLKIFEDGKPTNALVIRTYGGLGEKVVCLDHVCPLRRPLVYDLFVQNQKVPLDRHWSNYARNN